MKAGAFNHDSDSAVCYQIVQTYTGNDEGLRKLHQGYKLTYPKVFTSREATQELIKKIMNNPRFEGWTLKIEKKYGVISYSNDQTTDIQIDYLGNSRDATKQMQATSKFS